MGVVLETVNVTRYFGAVKAADDLSVQLAEGQTVGIVGPNGSGKTTFVNLVTGYVKPARGAVRFRGRDITPLTPRQITRLGIARSFQIPQLYLRLSVLENMLLALAIREQQHWDLWRPLKLPARVEEARCLLAQFGFDTGVDQPCAALPEGGRKLLDVALSFALRPSVLLLDEPTSGVSVEDKFAVMDRLMSVVRQSAITAVFIEHDMEVVARYAERVLVFAEGRILADGGPAAVFANPAVRTHVLGEGV
ncbi:MAG TPA: ABC transporter ATP-binding protein [Chloroflexota bacterium]|nr:ABC transporter ATP-binding protein [Chloroflexota bacterium]